jgi:capsular polysaccharide transport system permease protein
MIDAIEQAKPVTPSRRRIGWLQSKVVASVMRRKIIAAALIASVAAAVYWLAIASDRYVSEAHVIIQRTDLPGGQQVDFSSLLGGGGGGSRTDQLLLRDYLLSVDMLTKLDASLGLRAHYSDTARDPISRMWRQDLTIEWFQRYYLSRVSVEFDDYAGVLLIKAQAYDPKMAQAISARLVDEGERFMNALASNLAQEQVAFLEKQVNQMSVRALEARQAVLGYQNKKGLVSPQATAESIAGIVAKLEAQRTELQTQLSASQAYLVPKHPGIIQTGQQIAAVEKQITQEKAKLTSAGGQTLNRVVEEFQRLELNAVFAQDVYKTALVALEKGRIEATRTIKKVSVLQSPTTPEYALEPRRIYNTLVFLLIAMLVAGVLHLLAAIVRDHKD